MERSDGRDNQTRPAAPTRLPPAARAWPSGTLTSPRPGATAATAVARARATAARATAAAAAVAAAALGVLARGHRELLRGLQRTGALMSTLGTPRLRDSCSNASASTVLAAPRRTFTSVQRRS